MTLNDSLVGERFVGCVNLSSRQQAALAALGARLVADSCFEQAAFVYGMLASRAPNDGFVHRALGVCCERIDRLDDARNALDRALALDANDHHARVGLATVKMRSGDSPGAIAALEAVKAAMLADGGSNEALQHRVEDLLASARASAAAA